VSTGGCIHRFEALTACVDNRITGDLLVTMNAEDFKELGLSVGQRLAILKAVYLVKLAHDIPIGEDDYVPPCTHSVSIMSCHLLLC
jgi:hypothetical protein